MPTTKTPVTIAPMPTDRRVLALAAALGVTTRTAWAMAAEAWAWLQAEAGEDGVVPGATALLDAVADAEGLGAALVAAGLAGATEQGIVLPAELVRASRLLDGCGDVVAEDRKRKAARERQTRFRKRRRLTGRTSTRTTASTSAGGQQADQSFRPRRLGLACGHVVMLLSGRYGPYVQLTNAKPKLTASAEGHDFDTMTLADALELLVPQHEAHSPPGGGHRVPTLQALEDATRLERERQRAADADAARRDTGNAALLEAAAEAEDEAHERDGHAPVTPVTRDARDGHAFCHASAGAESTTSPSGGGDLDAVSCHASRHASGHETAASSTSSSLSSSHAQQRTTTTGTMDSSRPFERDRAPAANEAVPEWLRKDREARNQVRAERWASALGVTVDDIREMYHADKAALRVRLEAAGVNPDTGFPTTGPVAQGRASSAANANGIPIPDLGVDRLRAIVHEDHGGHEDDAAPTADPQTMHDDASGEHADVA
jgi:hypothetical protein